MSSRARPSLRPERPFLPIVCGLMTCFCLLTSLAASAETLVSNLTVPVRDVNAIAPLLWAAQGFETDARPLRLDALRALVGGETGSAGAFAELRTAAPTGEMDTTPAGLVATLVVPDLTGPRSARDFVPAAPITLAPSTRYYLLLGATGPDTFEWSYAEGNAQTGPGALVQYQYSFDGGVIWSQFGDENPFHLEVEGTPVGELVLVSNVSEPIRSFNEIDASTWSAQSFETDAQAYQLIDLRVLAGNAQSAPGAFAELRASTPSGEMDTTPAGLIDSLSVPDLSGPRALRTLLPSAPIALAPGTRYHLLIGSTGPGSFEWSYAEGNGQLGPGTLAQYQYTFDGGGLWSDFGSDNPFHTEVRALPEPGVGLACAVGFAAAAGLGRRRLRSDIERRGKQRPPTSRLRHRARLGTCSRRRLRPAGSRDRRRTRRRARNRPRSGR